jgi:hypothetical protein
MKTKTDKKLTCMPPTAFSNAINSIYPGFDFIDWENSREWKLFNAGMAYAAGDILCEARSLQDNSIKIARDGGLYGL